MAIDVKSYNQILGDMARKLIADAPINDLNTGSVLLTLLEAAAQVDFENSASILSVLELLNIDAVRNNDLDNRAADYGLSRSPSVKATGSVTITDSNITKKSTGLYQVKPAPVAGSTTIFVNDASTWSATGNLFIGRGTQQFEGPIAYTSITNNVSFFTITLASALQNSHLISETVVNAQGTTDRLIPAGTTVQIPANSQSPVVQFLTLRNAVIPAGETTVTGVSIVAAAPGSTSNAGIGTITSFESPPFTGATVTNSVALTDGADVESDDSLRERIKSYANTLARGTSAALLAAIIGVSDSQDSKQVASAVITEPAVIGDPSIVYIDDGSGFQPSFVGQSVDQLLNSASGNEEFLQLANFPLPRPQVINAAEAPYVLIDQMQFRVAVDDIEETITFSSSQFANISAALVSEVIIAINSQSVSFKATFTNDSSSILLFPVKFSAETIQVSAIKSTDNPLLFANTVLKFPTNVFSYIRLFQNNVLLHEQNRAATLITTPFTSWNITGPGDLVIAVDGTPPQDRSFSVSDFGGSPFNTLTLDQWVAAFNAKFAGITATATSGNTVQIVSNKVGTLSELNVLGGSYLNVMFNNLPTTSSGQNSDFQLNRQTGNLQILTTINPGDSISAGIADAKGSLFSSTTATGTYNVSTDSNNRPADMIIVADSPLVVPRVGINLAIGNTVTVSNQGSDTMRLMASTTTAFPAIQPNDYVYITSRGSGSGWVDPADTGLFKVIAKGAHTTAGTDTYIDVKNPNIVSGVGTVQASEDIQAFSADTYPQLWKGTFTAVPAVATIQNIADSLNSNIVNTVSTIFKTDSIKITSSTEDSGSIAIPVSVGNAASLFATEKGEQLGNPSMVANQTTSSDIATYFKRTDPTATNAEGVSGKIVWFDRVQYSDIKGPLTSSAVPGVKGTDTYGEVLQSSGHLTSANVSYDDIYNETSGANKGQYRSIRDKISGDAIGTQFELPNTIMDYVPNDTFNLMRPVELSSSDSIVVVMDEDAIDNTIDIPMWRTGLINSNFSATTVSFSATDADNQPGINFSNLTFWGKTANNTEFMNYAVWMQARNYYVSGGAGSGGGGFIIRSNEYGPHGENIRFSIAYPSSPNLTNTVTQANTPDYTQVTYFFGSSAAKTINVAAGNEFTVTALGNNLFRYSFITGAVSLATVVVGDILSILPSSGVSTANCGQFSIRAVNIVGNTVDVYNPNGAATGVGTPEVTHITTIADVVGTKTSSTVVVAPSGLVGSGIVGKWFLLNDSAGTVAVYYTLGSVPTPASLGVNRIIPVVVSNSDSASTITAETNGAIAADSQFTSTYFGLTLTIINAVNAPLAVASDSGTPTGFSFSGTTGTYDASVNGTYFILQGADGSVGFWYDTTGITPQPLINADRTVRISTVSPGDSANTIANKTAVAVGNDADFSTTVLSNVVTVTDNSNGPRPTPSAGTSGFTLTVVTSGIATAFETISIPTSFMVFSLANTSVANIVTAINTNPLVNAVAIAGGASSITFSTQEEVYTPAGIHITGSTTFGSPVVTTSNTTGIANGQSFIGLGIPPGATVLSFVTNTSITLTENATATSSETYVANPNYSASVGYGHIPYPNDMLNAYISLYDGINFVKEFENTDPNFTLKFPMVLQNAAPSAYSVINAPNNGSSTLGEYFKLVPVTLNNVYHHMTQKALSQLPIVAGVNISNNIRRIQIKSKKLGSAGAVEVLGGNANSVALSVSGEAQIAPGLTKNYLEVQTAAFPATLTKGTLVAVSNQQTTKRLSTLSSTDTMDVSIGINSTANYLYNNKVTGFNSSTMFTITDVSSTYGRPSGIVWRWTHGDLVTALEFVNVGDMLNVFGTFSGSWNSGNKANLNGSSKVAGFPIVGVNSGSKYIDVVNPYGVAMSATAVGSGTVSIVPTPILEWKLQHAAQSSVFHVVLAGPFGTATVTTNSPSHLREGDTFVLSDNGIAQTTTVATVISPTSFTFTDTLGASAGTYILGNVIRSGRTPTRYRIESLGFKNLYRLEYVQGDAPRFVDCGVAVDDVLVISGNTFDNSSNGRFQVAGVDNTSIIFTNPNAVEALNTLFPFNNVGTTVQWTSASNTVTGTAGAFKNVSIGDWVKQPNDDDSLFVQVIDTLNNSLVHTTSALATVLLLGSTYQGVTDVGPGVKFDEANDVNKGVILQDMGDVTVFNGDSVQVGDVLFVDKFASSSWFQTVNSGTFTITSLGTDLSTYRPYVTVQNATGQAQSGVALGVNLIGFSITEGEGAAYYSVRMVENTAIDSFNHNLRDIYMTPPTRAYKLSQSNGTQIVPLGKLGYPTNVTTGVDGYTYYTGLLQTVQYIIDGFEPNAVAYPGYRAVGGIIEVLPPLIHRVKIAVTVTTNNGVNLNDISNDVRSAIISYINTLGVGQPVILSEIIVKVMNITGISSVIFTNPSPSVASISVADNEHAFSENSDISIS